MKPIFTPLNYDCHVYVIAYQRNAGAPPCKVGISNKPHERLAQIQTSNPYKLCVVSTLKMPRKLCERAERFILDRFKSERLHGEWISASATDIMLAGTEFLELTVLHDDGDWTTSQKDQIARIRWRDPEYA